MRQNGPRKQSVPGNEEKAMRKKEKEVVHHEERKISTIELWISSRRKLEVEKLSPFIIRVLDYYKRFFTHFL
jgi:hypothetical protein